MTDPIVGIDLGTSNTVVAYAEATGSVRVLADEAGYKIHPSVVSFHPNGGVVVGAAAKQRKVIDPKNTIYSVKRLIGRRFDSLEVQTARKRSPFQMKEGPNLQPMIVTRAGEYAVPEISAIVLDHARNVAASALKSDVTRAVVTVPASFNDAQRSATATAGAIANLTVVRVLNEPTAAALAYGHTRGLHQIIAVYDFGGGTFDITILKLADQVYEVLGTAGDTFLGGDDLDERLVDRMVEKFLAENRIDLRDNEVSMMRLRAVAEQTKIELSRRSRAVVRVDEIAYGPNGKPLDLQIEITRDEFVKHISDIIDRSFPVCKEALQYAQLGIDGINDIILVGGTTKIPYVRDQVTQFFGKTPRTDVNPEDAVALGAALQATALERILGKRSTKSKPIAVPNSFSTDSDMQTETRETYPPASASATLDSDLEETNEAAPLDFDDVVEELTAEQPPPVQKRPTAGYSEVMRAEAPTRVGERPVDRPPERGAHHDVFEERTPIPAASKPLARIAKPAPPNARTIPGAPVEIPQDRSRPNALPPGAKTAQPIPAQRPPSPPSQPPPIAQMPMPPVAPPQAPTIMLPPSPPPRAESTLTLEPEQSPSSTAKGFAPPQTYPVMPAPVVIDVTPRGLGIGTVAGFCEELIRRNSRVPAEIRKVFVTGRDRQEAVRIVVVQGESRRMEGNMVLGDLTLSDLPPRPRGETSIEVTFHIDASGILQVRARDAQTGREQRATLDLVGAMPAAEIAGARDRLTALRR